MPCNRLAIHGVWMTTSSQVILDPGSRPGFIVLKTYSAKALTGWLRPPVYNAVGAGHLISPELQYRYHPLPGFPTLIAHVPSEYVHLRQLDRDLSSALVRLW